MFKVSIKKIRICIWTVQVPKKIELFSIIPNFNVLFIYYINDLPEAINSDLKIFADDTKTFSEIKTTEDRDALQNDFDLLVEWSEKWLLKFNSKKCKVLGERGVIRTTV